MMRFQFAVNTVLGAVLITPALTLGFQQNESLDSALRRTVASLEELARIEQRLRENDPSAISEVLRVTEAPLATAGTDPAARDNALQDLRGVVGKLQRELDELEHKSDPTVLAQTSRIPSLSAPTDSEIPTAPELTTGLDDTLRRRLGERVRPAAIEAPRPTPTTKESATSVVDPKTSFESAGYTADAVRLGRAHYRQGEFALALANFEQAPQDPEALYWKARSLEKLRRETEAIAAYNQVLALETAGYLAQRAKEDVEFLQWRLAFERTRSKTAESKP